jgi:hypothetical protein
LHSVTISEAVKILSQKFLMQEGIAGVSHRGALIVYVETPEDLHKVPETIMGYRVEARVVGRIYALGALARRVPERAGVGRALSGQAVDKKARVRPVPGGCSCGHPNVTAGTASCWVYDSKTGGRLLLSNCHVIAASNMAKVNDPILQPGPYDGGKVPDDVVAYLDRFVEIKRPPALNLVDAAVARPADPSAVSDEVLDVGVVRSTADAAVGLRAAKSGRTSCYTEGTVQDVNAAVKVYGYPWGYSIFEDQIITTKVAEPGDSGSLLVDASTKAAVGLVFAGSEVITVANKTSHVARLLGISFAPPAPPPPTPPPRPLPPLATAVALAVIPVGLGLALVATAVLPRAWRA